MEANANKADLFVMCCWLIASLDSIVFVNEAANGQNGGKTAFL